MALVAWSNRRVLPVSGHFPPELQKILVTVVALQQKAGVPGNLAHDGISTQWLELAQEA
jgi:hypothetical protein